MYGLSEYSDYLKHTFRKHLPPDLNLDTYITIFALLYELDKPKLAGTYVTYVADTLHAGNSDQIEIKKETAIKFEFWDWVRNNTQFTKLQVKSKDAFCVAHQKITSKKTLNTSKSIRLLFNLITRSSTCLGIRLTPQYHPLYWFSFGKQRKKPFIVVVLLLVNKSALSYLMWKTIRTWN